MRGCELGNFAMCRRVATTAMTERQYVLAHQAAQKGCALGDDKLCKLVDRAGARRDVP
jgi:hypothetical protein